MHPGIGMSDRNTELRHAVCHLRSTPPRLLEEPNEGGATAGQGDYVELEVRVLI